MLLQITIAVTDPILRSRLERIVTCSYTHTELITKSRLFWKQIRRKTNDVIIVSREFIPKLISNEIRALQDLPGIPSIVIIADTETSRERAQYIAAGFDVLLESHLPANVLKKAVSTILAKRARLAPHFIPAEMKEPEPLLDSFVADSTAMQKFMKMARRAVKSDTAVLILGETGVGKERLAHTIHNESPRSENPFVAINCGVFQETILESELFGHEEGAFTGALRSRRGCFEMAHSGTLFLDEICEIPTHLQVKLLRVLEEKKIQRLGGEKPMSIDVRILAATNRDIESEVRAGRFRKDLYYRLDVFRMTIPPLRKRLEDIPELAREFIAFMSRRIGSDVRGITDDAVERLCLYDWPGNVRELFNVLERAILLCENDMITPDDLPLHVSAALAGGPDVALANGLNTNSVKLSPDWQDKPLKYLRKEVYEQVERKYLAHLLQASHGKVGVAAQKAGINQRALYTKMKHYGLHKEKYR
ncbi:MAG: sigma-54-dependent Fis family transcriptional regulator [Sedimentisphaerales bacterium]|nr:sigma-54-dependent Fis family transcriptional regulator [Sedimentisphaerales bacterium]